MRFSIFAMLLLIASPVAAQSNGAVLPATASSGVYVITGSIGSPPPKDMIINSRNEGLILIRKVQDCQMLADHLKESPDIVRAECRPQ